MASGRHFLISGVMALLLAGCSTQGLIRSSDEQPLEPAADERFLIEHKVRDARYQDVIGIPHIKVDYPLRLRIPEYEKQQGLTEKKAFIADFLRQAAALGDRYMETAVRHVPRQDVAAFNRSQPTGGAQDGSHPYEAFAEAYKQGTQQQLGAQLAELLELRDSQSVDRYWQQLTANIEESIMTKDRTTRRLETAPLVPFIEGWIKYHALTDDRGPHVPEFRASRVYSPPRAEGSEEVDPAELDGWQLLRYFAPTITQEHVESPPYDPNADYFGAAYLQGASLDEAMPGVDSSRPTLYAFMENKTIQGIEVKQLVYVLWYPEQPKLKSFDPEAGIMEGWTFRITLNPENRPVVYESVSNCGCYHKIFPSDHLERWAREEYGAPLEDKVLAVEQIAPGIQAAVPETVVSPRGKPRPVTLYYSAGHHQLITIRQIPMELKGTRTEATYDLVPYERLENLPFNGYLASLFGEDGLVREAHRAECDLLKPSGLYHAGHARQRGTQMVNFDEQVFDDPELLEIYLRLPSRAFGRTF